MTFDITLKGGVAIDAAVRDFTVSTDQPFEGGGMNAAPNPFELFLASIGTCSAYFALRFCNERGIDTEGLRLTLDAAKGSGKRKLDKIAIRLHLPPHFPEKYRGAIVKAAEQCAVKQVILDPPEFETTVA